MIDYKTAGVDVQRGDDFVEHIAELVKKTNIPGVISSIGHFAGLFELSAKKMKNPVLVACTDGVGTKLKLAFEMNRHSSIGIDLVAMSINDLLVTGASPLFFLDYLATSNLDLKVHIEVIKGIVEGCRISECALLGGETAEMPGIYAPHEYDLAGFAVGIVEKKLILSGETIVKDDILIGLPSTGVHSNGYSLVRKIFADRQKYPWDRPVEPLRQTLGEALLAPTRIYKKEMDILKKRKGLKSIAHITGEGIPGNLPRVLPEGYGAEIILDTWPEPAIYKVIAREGPVDRDEMFSVFNMGLGMIAVASKRNSNKLISDLRTEGLQAYQIGRVVTRPGIHFISRSNNKNIEKSMISSQKTQPQCRIAVLGSGRGSNFEAICQAIDRGELCASVECVISNNSKAFILDRARKRGIPAYHLSSCHHPEGPDFETALLTLLLDHRIDLICLAGYMKKIPAGVLKSFPSRILNIHPALLPAFGGPGMYGPAVHQAVLTSGAQYSGASVHLVSDEYDTGLILAQDIVRVMHDDTVEILAERVLKIEHSLYPKTISSWIEKLNMSGMPKFLS
jgi:formyltetrahydrofolate-dependent phosphoribosylglycinamide formyltransferase